MLQIKKDADLNLLHKEVSIAIVLHARVNRIQFITIKIPSILPRWGPKAPLSF